jgi:phosphohistidine swiveling domain-containing protein
VNLLNLFNRIVIGIKGDRTDVRKFLREAVRSNKIIITDSAVERAVKDLEKAGGVVIENVEPVETKNISDDIVNEELTNLAY